MEKIKLKHIKLYIEFSGEYALMFEGGVSDGVQKRITSEQFAFIDCLVSNLQIIEANYAGKNYVDGIKKSTDKMREEIELDAYNEIVNNMNSYQETRKPSYFIKTINYLYGVMKLFSVFLIAIICFGLYKGDEPNDVIYWYIGFISLTIILYPILKKDAK
ncbi:MAG: hypothetical protein COB15_00970 [Flavobacteriales bacterium]|nr:MAG: hypothetical protein COB15_00970 [Flavobacteriales bacterium]